MTIIISLMKSTTGMNDCNYISEFNFLGALNFPVVSPKVYAPNELNKYWTATEEKKIGLIFESVSENVKLLQVVSDSVWGNMTIDIFPW